MLGVSLKMGTEVTLVVRAAFVHLANRVVV